MAYCTKCGAFVKDGAKFCGICGEKIESNIGPDKQADAKNDGSQRKTKFEGELHKCPNCGTLLNSFVKNCPECGYELRGASGVESVQEFAKSYSVASSNSQKIDLIRTFVIPNTKEDILEFVILASSNIDTTTYTKDNVIVSGGISQQDVTEAWMAKFEQAYQKATLLLSGTQELNNIEKLYLDKKVKVETCRKSGTRKAIWNSNKKWIGIVAAILGYCLLFFGFPIFMLGSMLDSGERKLEKQVKQIEAYISDGDYDAALTAAYAMDDNYSSSWTETRSNLISRINELKGLTEGKVKIPNSDYEDQQYTDIVALFQKAGFTNVTSEKVPDLITGWIHKEGEVIEVTIDGNTSFVKGEYCDSNAAIVVKYHGYSD